MFESSHKYRPMYFHPDDREKHPELFLLSIDEAQLILRASEIKFSVLIGYVDVDEEEIKKPALQSQLVTEIFKAFKENDISTDELLAICEPALKQKYWSYSLSQMIVNNDDTPITQIYRKTSNVPGIDGEILQEEYPLFYEGKHSLPELAIILDIPEGVLFASPLELSELKSLYSICKKTNLDSVFSKRLFGLEYPLDKPNSTIWNMLETETGRQIKLDVTAAGKRDRVNLLYSIDFDNLPEGVSITKKLEPYDKQVYIAISGLYNEGYPVISVTMIYKAMGGTSDRPSGPDIEKINQSITKMSSAHIFLDNSQEVIRKEYRYPTFKYDASLLPMERVQAVINGRVAESAIKLFREPPLMTFAKERKQVTTISLKLLQAPINKTNQNIAIQDYLIERIAHAKNGTGKKKILYATVYEKVGITSTKQRQRAPEKIHRYLDHFKSEKGDNFIKDYRKDRDGVTIIL